jgi:hypothetical protein
MPTCPGVRPPFFRLQGVQDTTTLRAGWESEPNWWVAVSNLGNERLMSGRGPARVVGFWSTVFG